MARYLRWTAFCPRCRQRYEGRWRSLTETLLPCDLPTNCACGKPISNKRMDVEGMDFPRNPNLQPEKAA